MSTAYTQMTDAATEQWMKGERSYRATEAKVEEFRQDLADNREHYAIMEKENPTKFHGTVSALLRLQQELNTHKLYSMFPDDDYFVHSEQFRARMNLKRGNYRKHVAFVNATAENQYMAFFAGNRVGKTQLGAYMTACHLTGLYPPWWRGHRFHGPIQAWAVVENYESTKDPVQKMLFGRFFPGQNKSVTGMGTVPKPLIDMKSLVGRGGAAPDVLASVSVRHVASSGRENYSQLHFKSFEQSEQSFVGRGVDWIWIDEGPSWQIFDECCMRVVTQNGRLILTWTPLDGYTPVVRAFIPANTSFGKVFDAGTDVVKVTEKSGLVMAGWDDIPHIPKREMDSLIQHFRDIGQTDEMINARMKGIPHVGAGKIYNMPRDELYYDPAQMGRFPAHWKHAYGLDHGWLVTAAIWGALDPDTDILYLYSEHYGQQKDVAHNARAIKARGKWIHGVIDPAAQQRGQNDGKRMLDEYRDEDLLITPAENAVEAGIEAVKRRMFTGRLKVARNLQRFWKEYDVYERIPDDEQDIAKIRRKDNHLMDAMRYLIMSGLKVACSRSQTERTGMDRPFRIYRPGEI